MLGVEERRRHRDWRPRRPWVAEITGPDPRYGLAREFLRGRRSYRHASRTGCHGIYQWYELQEGRIYEVCAPLTATRWERYFCRVDGRHIRRMDDEEARACLSVG